MNENYEDSYFIQRRKIAYDRNGDKQKNRKEATEFGDFVKSVTNVLNEDNKVEDIIFEETGAYYEGQKSAEEVADIIQSRVSIYLAEGMD